jgi:micrococcal nuclease
MRGPLLRLCIAGVAALAAAAAVGCGSDGGDARTSTRAPREFDPDHRPRLEVVERVIDGDTFVVRGGERIRIIGIDAPEWPASGIPDCFGPAATAKLRQLLKTGDPVTLTSDAEPRDRYGRTLAYVTTGEHDLGAQLLAAGVARVMRIEPNIARAETYSQIEAEARADGRGLWSEC